MRKLFIILALSGAAFAQQKDSNFRGLASVLFANLGTPANGNIVYCSDCTSANPAAGGGTGAVARRENGVWNSGGGGGGGGGATVPNVLTATGGGTTTLTIGGNIAACSVTTCEVRVGSVIQGFTANATATITVTDPGGTFGYILKATPSVIVLGDTSSAITCTGCTAVTGITAFPADSIPLFSVTNSGATWGTPTPPVGVSADGVTCGAGLTCSQSGGITQISSIAQVPCTSVVTDITTLSAALAANGANTVTCVGPAITNSLTAAVAVTNNNVTVRCLNSQAVIQRIASQTFNAFNVSASVLNFTIENCNIDMSNGTSGTALVLQGNGTLNTSTGHRLLNLTVKAAAATTLGSSAITLQNGVGSTLIDNYRGTGNAGTIYISGAANDIQINHSIIRIDDPSAAGYDAVGIHTTTAGKAQDNIIVDDLQVLLNGGCYAVEAGAFTTTAPTLPALSEYPTHVKVSNAHTKLLANSQCGGYSFAFASGPQLVNSSFDANGFTAAIASLEMAGALNYAVTNFNTLGATATLNCSPRGIIADSYFDNNGITLTSLLKMGQTTGNTQVCGTANGTDDVQLIGNIFKCSAGGCTSGNHGMVWVQANDGTGSTSSTASRIKITSNKFLGSGNSGEAAIVLEGDATVGSSIVLDSIVISQNEYRNVNNTIVIYGNNTGGVTNTTIDGDTWISAANLGFAQGTVTSRVILDQPLSLANWQSFGTLLEGSQASLTDANTPTNGAIITGSGSVHAKGYFDGTNPVVFTSTRGNCASGASPAVCAANTSGAVAITTGVNPTLVVNTTAVTSSSRISLTVDDTLTIGGTTCNSTLATLVGGMAVTARTAGTSFTVSYNGTISVNPLCLSYRIDY